jgi:catechol 2,3-dioxygenase-like lactoylglutathione lyase family enzyme
MSTGTEVKLSKIGTIMLAVKDTRASVTFYRDVLGLALRFATDEFAFLDGGGVTLGLRRSANIPAGENLRSEVVFDVDDIDAAYRALSARGVVFTRDPRVATADRYVTDFRDPDGNALSIFGPRAGT